MVKHWPHPQTILRTDVYITSAYIHLCVNGCHGDLTTTPIYTYQVGHYDYTQHFLHHGHKECAKPVTNEFSLFTRPTHRHTHTWSGCYHYTLHRSSLTNQMLAVNNCWYRNISSTMYMHMHTGSKDGIPWLHGVPVCERESMSSNEGSKRASKEYDTDAWWML